MQVCRCQLPMYCLMLLWRRPQIHTSLMTAFESSSRLCVSCCNLISVQVMNLLSHVVTGLRLLNFSRVPLKHTYHHSMHPPTVRKVTMTTTGQGSGSHPSRCVAPGWGSSFLAVFLWLQIWWVRLVFQFPWRPQWAGTHCRPILCDLIDEGVCLLL